MALFTDYAALMTPPPPPPSPDHGGALVDSAGAAATGRFYFRKKTLQYSFLFGPALGWPAQLTFLDNSSNILEEFSLAATHLQNRTEKLCGAWARLPRKYRKTLRSEELSVSLR